LEIPNNPFWQFRQHAKSFCERKLSASELEIVTTLGGYRG
jgi:hypothetical protein